MENSKHSTYKSENIETKYLNNMRKTLLLKVKLSLLELKKNFIELKDKELKDREVKIKRELLLCIKPITVSTDDMYMFEQKEMKKKRPIKNTWYDWLISYVPNPIRKTVGGFKGNVVSLFKTNTLEEYGKQTVHGSGNRPSKLKIQKQTEDNIIKSIRNLFELKKRK